MIAGVRKVFFKNKLYIYILISVIALTVLLFLDFYLKIDYKDIIVEAHGLLMDVLLFGIVLTIYDSVTEKKRKIDSLEEQLQDYKGWNEKQASIRLISIFRRLRKLGVNQIDLSYSYLEDVFFDNDFSMENVNFSHSQLVHCRLIDVSFVNSQLIGTHIRYSALSIVDFTGSSLCNAYFRNTRSFHKINFTNADLRNASLKNIRYGSSVNFTGANLQGMHVEEDWFSNIKKAEVIGYEEIVKKYEIYSASNDGIFRLRKKISKNSN